MSDLNYFALEPVIVDRIKSAMPEIDEVYTPFSVDEMLELTNSPISAHVIYVGDRVGESVGQGKANSVYQQWLVVLAINDPGAQQQQTKTLRATAAPLINKLLGAMQGFDPQVTRYRPFKRTNDGVGVGHSAGFAYFPFMIESQMLVT